MWIFNHLEPNSRENLDVTGDLIVPSLALSDTFSLTVTSSAVVLQHILYLVNPDYHKLAQRFCYYCGCSPL